MDRALYIVEGQPRPCRNGAQQRQFGCVLSGSRGKDLLYQNDPVFRLYDWRFGADIVDWAKNLHADLYGDLPYPLGQYGPKMAVGYVFGGYLVLVAFYDRAMHLLWHPSWLDSWASELLSDWLPRWLFF